MNNNGKNNGTNNGNGAAISKRSKYFGIDGSYYQGNDVSFNDSNGVANLGLSDGSYFQVAIGKDGKIYNEDGVQISNLEYHKDPTSKSWITKEYTYPKRNIIEVDLDKVKGWTLSILTWMMLALIIVVVIAARNYIQANGLTTTITNIVDFFKEYLLQYGLF